MLGVSDGRSPWPRVLWALLELELGLGPDQDQMRWSCPHSAPRPPATRPRSCSLPALPYWGAGSPRVPSWAALGSGTAHAEANTP